MKWYREKTETPLQKNIARASYLGTGVGFILSLYSFFPCTVPSDPDMSPATIREERFRCIGERYGKVALGAWGFAITTAALYELLRRKS
ncbi:MAG: hypothetical protein OXR66_04125 [Candidatus Woesearchaeota archaeon]|nr:hypothetical protein [Candidatus Woesearchaeota archaeon]